MLCSAKELGLADSSEGILELPADAPVGADLRAYLQLDDDILELNVTPNRGDAMSVLGIAREVAALTRAAMRRAASRSDAVAIARTRFPVKLSAPGGLPEVREPRRPRHRQRRRHRRRGCASACAVPACAPISPVVDVTNYVMLELGQPMHAYDLEQAQRRARSAAARRPARPITLLDGKDIKLEPDVRRDRRCRRARGHGRRHGRARELVHRRNRPTCSSKPRSSRRPPLPAAGAAMGS